MIRILMLLVVCVGIVMQVTGCAGQGSYAGVTKARATKDAQEVAHRSPDFAYAYVFKIEKTKNPFGDKAWRAFINANQGSSSPCVQVYVWAEGDVDQTYSQNCP